MNKKVYQDVSETVFSEKLENGLMVFLLPKPEMEKAYSIFTTNYGSIDQTFTPIGKTEKVTVPEGVAHFLEHKLFEKEDRDVFADFGKQGASPNAYTSFTKTAYLFSTTSNVEKNVETLLDFVQDPYFSEKSVEKEKGIIAQEIKMYDDQPDWQSFMGTIKALFKNHPVNIDIAGTVESINSITKEDLYTCYQTFYHPENMSLFVAGNFRVEEMMDLIRSNQKSKSFSKMEQLQRYFPDEPAEAAKPEYTLNMPVSIPKCTVGIKEASSELSKEDFLQKDLLGGMILSHLYSKGGTFYQDLYQDKLIDDSFYYETNIESNFGYTFIGSNTERPGEFSKKVKEQLLSTKKMQLNDEEFDRMKKKRIGQMLRSMNSLEFIASKYIYYYTAGLDLFEIIPAIAELKLTDANDYLKRWIDEERIAVCTIAAE